MPYRRGYRRNYRRNYRRRYPTKGYGTMDLVKTATAAYRGVQYLRGLVNVEKHALDSQASLMPDNTVGALECLNLIAQGDAEQNRQGDSIMMKSIHCNLKFTINSSATHTNIRIIMFLYKQPQGATPTLGFILSTVNTTGVYNHDNAGLYTILYDKSVNLSITGQQETYRQITRKFYQLHERFDGAAASVGDIQTNALWLAFISDEATNHPTVSVRSQLLFIDN